MLGKVFKDNIKALLATSLLFSAGMAQAAETNNVQQSTTQQIQSVESNSQKNQQVATFTLNLWAPDEVAPPEAKLAEIGDSYQYLYTPDSLQFSTEETNRVGKFKFHKDVKDRYEFRWITASHPQHVTLEKMKDKKIVVKLDDGEVASNIYFEVWVYDTLTGKSFMCDPDFDVEPPPVPPVTFETTF